MNTRKFTFYALAILLGGCVPVASLHPLYTEKDLVRDDRIIGSWTEDPDKPGIDWRFEPFEDKAEQYKNAYKFTLYEKGKIRGLFAARLLKLDDNLYLDITPEAFPYGKKDVDDAELPYNSLFFVRAHTFMAVEFVESNLVVKMTINDKLKKLLVEKPRAVWHAEIDDRIILTAPTDRLQNFVRENLEDARLFGGKTTLQRIERDEQ